MIFNILDNNTEFWMTKYIVGEIFSSGRATLYKNLIQSGSARAKNSPIMYFVIHNSVVLSKILKIVKIRFLTL